MSIFLMIKGRQHFVFYFPNVAFLMIKGKQDFAIFQVGYKNPNKKIEPFDQRLVLNLTLLKNNFKNSLRIGSNFIV